MGLATEPIVVDGVIYVSAPQSRVYAVDALSGKVLWRFDPKVRLDRMRNSWSAHSNRGLAVWARQSLCGHGRLPPGRDRRCYRRKILGVAGVRWFHDRYHRCAARRQGQGVHRLQRLRHRSARISDGLRCGDREGSLAVLDGSRRSGQGVRIEGAGDGRQNLVRRQVVGSGRRAMFGIRLRTIPPAVW